MSRDETNWEETSPLIEAFPPRIPPALTTTGAHPFPLELHACTPSCPSVSRSGCMGLLLMLESPVSTTYPSGASENADVMNLSVVPEFSTLTTSSGTLGRVPFIVSAPSCLSILAPIAAHASTVALVSRERSGLRIVRTPPAPVGRS